MHVNFNEITKVISPLALDERAKVIENVVRYLVMLHSHVSSLAYAKQLLKRFEDDSQLVGWLASDKQHLKNICLGVACELNFYWSFWDKLELVPTLDAGCAFDFVGRTPKNTFLRIDVTHNVECKKEKAADHSFGGPSSWKKLFAQVNDEGCRLFDENFKPNRSIKLKSPVGVKRLKAPYCVLNLEYFVARHRWLHFMEFGGTENLVLAELATAQKFYSVSHGMLYAHVLFYIRYRKILKLVPALSCGDCTDFIGETNGQLIRYWILTDPKAYTKKLSGYLLSRENDGFRYQLVKFDVLTREYSFHNFTERYEINPYSIFEKD